MEEKKRIKKRKVEKSRGINNNRNGTRKEAMGKKK